MVSKMPAFHHVCLLAVALITMLSSSAAATTTVKENKMQVNGVFASTELMGDLTILERELIRELEKLYLQSVQATDHIKQHMDEWRNSQPHSNDKINEESERKMLIGNLNGTTAAPVTDRFTTDVLQDEEAGSSNYTVRVMKLLDSVTPGDHGHAAHHPIDAYLLIKRRTHSYYVMTNALKKLAKSIKSTLSEINNDEADLLPKADDFHGTAESLIRMQKMYKLSVRNLVQGIVNQDASGGKQDIVSQNKLELWDVLFLGESAERIGYSYESREWYAEAAAMLDLGAQLPPGTEHMLTKLKTATVEQKKLSDIEHQLDVTETDLPKFNTLMGPEETLKYQVRLCAGEQVRSVEYEATLYCKLETHGSPYLLMMPFKKEILSLSPPVVLYRKFLSPAQVETIKRQAKPNLDLAEVHGEENTHSTMERISMTSFIGKPEYGDPSTLDDLHPEVDESDFLTDMNKKIERATQLRVASTKASERYQVANYGIGGMYNLHFDFGKKERRNGERLGTFLIYLTDIEAGGGTVFPRLGVGVQPELGTALFWHNLKPNGMNNQLMYHAGCPVLHGDKWIVTKWILYDENIRKFPCGLSNYAKLSL
uniref:procollagen-proline 4-dioxygenase n=1 Tax=Hirondellea gigas TaxID=1518452 RepID=A0A6A7G8X2_9CRUS